MDVKMKGEAQFSLIGRTANEPISRDGCVSLRIAINHRSDAVTFVNVAAFEGRADLFRECESGEPIFLSGQLSESVVTGNNGAQQRYPSLVAYTIYRLRGFRGPGYFTAQILGNLTADPVMIEDKEMVRGSIAVNHRRGGEDAVSYFRFIAFEKVAKVLSEEGGKGQSIFVDGRVQDDSWVRDDGTKVSRLSLVLRDMRLLTPAQAIETSAAFEEKEN